MKDPDGRLADYIAMATLCRRMAVALAVVDRESLEQVLGHAVLEAEKALETRVSSNPAEQDLLHSAARSELTFVKTIRRWVRPGPDGRRAAAEPPPTSRAA